MIPISIHPLFWLISFLIGWLWSASLLGALITVVLILFSVLFHELGHALTARLFGQNVRIELSAFGGLTYRQGRKLHLWEEFLVVLNGPLFGFFLFLGSYHIYTLGIFQNPLILFTLRFLFVANFFWTVMNLLPVMPLDGGHLLSITLEAIFGFNGVKIANILGLICSIILCVAAFSIGLFLVGALFLLLTFENIRALRYYTVFTEKDRDPEIQEIMRTADQSFANGEHIKALEELEKVRQLTEKGILFNLATQEEAEIYKDQGKFEEAYHVLKPIKTQLSGDQLCLLHYLAYMNRDYQQIIEIGDLCYQEDPNYQTALINALGHGALKNAKAAKGWLDCALREGLPSLEDVLQSEELQPLLSDPLFQKYRSKFKE